MPTQMKYLELAPADVTVGQRHRKDMGDLQALAASIREVGLIHPIVIRPDRLLVAGQRRLLACRDVLRWPTIPCRVVDIGSIVAGEHAENELRKDFTPSERVSIAEAVAAEIGSRQGQRTDVPTSGDSLPHNCAEVPADSPASGKRKKAEPRPAPEGQPAPERISDGSLPHNCAEVRPGQETRDAAANAAGFGSHEDYRRAKAVTDNGVPGLIEAMDQGTVSIAAAAAAAKLSPDKQEEVVRKVQAGAKVQEAIREARGQAPRPPRPAAKTAPAGEDNGDDAEPTPAPGVDRVGLPVPAELAPVFAELEKVRHVRSLFRKLTRSLSALAQGPAGAHLARYLSRREKQGKESFRSREIEQLAHVVKVMAPHCALCPYCYHEHPGLVASACKACLGLGWVPVEVWNRAPEDYRAAVESLVPTPAAEQAEQEGGQ